MQQDRFFRGHKVSSSRSLCAIITMSGEGNQTKQPPAGGDDDDHMSVDDAANNNDDADAVAVPVAADVDLGGNRDKDGGAAEERQGKDGAVQVAAAVVGNEEGSGNAADDDEEVEAVASVVEEDDNDGDEPVVDAEDVGDDNEPSAEQPAVVVAMEDVEEGGDDDIPEVEAVAIVEEEPPQPKHAKSVAKPKAAPKKSASGASKKSLKRPTATKTKSASSTATTKKRTKGKSGTSKAGETAPHFAKIDSKRMEAANGAREMLYEAVPRLPFPVSESSSDQYYVRNFGRLKIGTDEISSKFSTPTALYPVGYSCDRYEFSPSHGRILKLRCSIIDGKTIGETGPIFRVMWGQGIDDDVDKVEYPYDPFTNSAPITGESGDDDAVAIPTSPTMHQPIDQQVVPAVGMRVKARFDKNQYYHGTITKVVEKEEGGNSAKSKKKKRKAVHMTILYDDGSTEETTFPDPDVTLAMPGMLTQLTYYTCHSV